MLREQASAGDQIVWYETDQARDLQGFPVQPTRPKPDIYVGFQIYEPRSEFSPLGGFIDLPYFQNFTVETLYQLRARYGLISSPTPTFASEMKTRKASSHTISPNDSIPLHHRLCFPWAVVELKQEKASLAEKCYCQAANAASVSLSMMEKLANFADAQHEKLHVPPVVAFTFVGPAVKLWIAYSEPKDDGARNHVGSSMLCF
jgi:hypothetical protein